MRFCLSSILADLTKGLTNNNKLVYYELQLSYYF